jgi:putative peptidoglycan lipid II flippase
MMDEASAAATTAAARAADGRVLRSAALVGSGTVLVKLLALAKDWLVADRFGAGDALDAYLVAFLIPSFAVAVVAHSFGPALLPTYVRVGREQGAQAARHLATGALLSACALLVAVTLGLVLIGPHLLRLVGSGFNDAKLALAQRLFGQMAIVLVASGVSAVLGAVLNAHERFALPALAALAVPAGMLLTLMMGGDRWGIESLSAGTSLGFAAESLILAAIAIASGLLAWPAPGALSGQLREVAGHYWPMVTGTLLMSSSLLVDQAMAASLGSGNVSVLNYAGKLVALVLSVVAVSLSTALFPRFSHLIAAGQWQELRRMLARFSRGVLILSLPVVVGLSLVGESLVRLVFERGAFTAETTAAVGQVQLWLFPQIPFYVLAMIGWRMLSALNANRTVLCLAALNLTLNVVGNYVLMHWFGVRGIAMSTSLVYLVAAGATFLAIRIKLNETIRRTTGR